MQAINTTIEKTIAIFTLFFTKNFSYYNFSNKNEFEKNMYFLKQIKSMLKYSKNGHKNYFPKTKTVTK